MNSYISDYISGVEKVQDFSLWEKKINRGSLISFTIELTPRCNNECRHCYINRSVNDRKVIEDELSLSEIKDIIDQAVDLGAVWCLLTGGEPLLRDDFEDIYMYAKRKGLLVTVFTNGTLISERHVNLFMEYPPRDLEVTVYGVSERIYGQVTGKPKLFKSFQRGVNLLVENNIKFNLKAVAIRSNIEEFDEISEFCRKYSFSPFRFDPLIHLRYDQDEKRNEDIKKERLSPSEIAKLEKSDADRHRSMMIHCDKFIFPENHSSDSILFHCGAGLSDFVVSYNGLFRLCPSLWHPETLYDLKKGNLKDAMENFVPKVRSMKSTADEYKFGCGRCRIINLCMWCPAHSFLESGRLDNHCRYFCEVAEARKNNILN